MEEELSLILSGDDEVKECACCGRTVEMFEILNRYFSRNISLKQVGQYEESLCSECVAELQQITFEQVYYGDPRMKVKDLQDKCIAILFNREHPNVEIDEELCNLLSFYQHKIDGLKQHEAFSVNGLKQYFNNTMNEWNATHRHKSFVSIEPMNDEGTLLNIYVRMTLSPSRTEGFSVKMELRSNHGFGSDSIIPFKVD